MERSYLCIDLKTFYASVECRKRGLDPFKTNLVVADSKRGKGTICLAVSPALKKLGVKNRCRLYEIPDNIKYLTAMPKMRDYINASAYIYEIYLKFISKEDIYVYSIDECFFDVTDYLKFYKKTPKELAIMMIDEVYKLTGITATAGIGSNLFLAKVAMDIVAKHDPSNIGILDYESFKEKLWFHEPLTDIWNIGAGITKRLFLKFNVTNLYGITRLKESDLYKEFGVNARFLIDHAWGIEPITLKEIKNYQKQSESLSNGQVLLADYSYDEAYLVLKEMVELSALELVKRKKVTKSISLYIGYSKEHLHKGSSASLTFDIYTNSYKYLLKEFMNLFKKITLHNLKIRRINLGFNNLINENFAPVDFFCDLDAKEKEHNLSLTINELKERFGKNAIFKAMNLYPMATTLKRNTLIGGHNSE